MQSRNQQIATWAFYGIASIALLLLPLVLSPFQVNLMGKFLTFAIVAIGLDIIWGYTGMLSLGQGLFFGLGAYCFGMYLNLEAAGENLPDFMGLYGVEQLPWFWVPFSNPVFAIAMSIIIPMIVATLLGFMLFRSRIQGVYFSIITQAFTAIVSLLFVGQQKLINGTNGLTEFKTVFGFTLVEESTQTGMYITTVIVMILIFIGSYALVKSRFGRLLIAVRDDEDRLRFVGYNPAILKTIAFAISAGVAGIAGALFVPQVGIISPQQLGIVASIEIVIWVAVGGRGTLIGAVIGALLVNVGKSTISSISPDLWSLIMGVLFVLVVLVMPNGIIGLFQSGVRLLQNGTSQRSAVPTKPSEEIESISA